MGDSNDNHHRVPRYHSGSLTQPLLGRAYDDDGDDDNNNQQVLLASERAAFSAAYARRRRAAKAFMSSKTKHYMILGLVTLDVSAILADILITLVSCDLGKKDEVWVGRSQETLYIVGLIFSSLFLVELVVSVWASGLRFFKDWFHCFDAFVIIASFVIDVLTRGVLEEIASLVIILRLWRLVKIIEELSVGASESLEDIEAKVAHLEKENAELRAQVETMRNGS
ncbi:hypothetical protein B0H66DRAFT_301714 [Apodospora peruviana]|uniref:Voltage-gated hydrogen channel 1 n=1 Tax=Apodospora peruviana TaxID=516989 RepID=A0AAE0M2I5_9PEZI|nr:hypothetical protein B0H66DRAFT_301714 [Apodospora peruviana]